MRWIKSKIKPPKELKNSTKRINTLELKTEAVDARVKVLEDEIEKMQTIIKRIDKNEKKIVKEFIDENKNVRR